MGSLSGWRVLSENREKTWRIDTENLQAPRRQGVLPPPHLFAVLVDGTSTLLDTAAGQEPDQLRASTPCSTPYREGTTRPPAGVAAALSTDF